MKLKNNFIKLDTPKRLYQINSAIIGLTGGIATGKSTACSIFKDAGLKVISADQLVKNIYSLNASKEFIRLNFPLAIQDDQINFKWLREKVFGDEKSRLLVEGFIYQKLPEAFKTEFEALGSPSLIIYDVPLLFEKKMEQLFDLTVLVYAPRSLQKQRLMNRDQISDLLAEKMLNQQMDIEVKKEMADVIIENQSGEQELKKRIQEFLLQFCEA